MWAGWLNHGRVLGSSHQVPPASFFASRPSLPSRHCAWGRMAADDLQLMVWRSPCLDSNWIDLNRLPWRRGFCSHPDCMLYRNWITMVIPCWTCGRPFCFIDEHDFDTCRDCGLLTCLDCYGAHTILCTRRSMDTGPSTGMHYLPRATSSLPHHLALRRARRVTRCRFCRGMVHLGPAYGVCCICSLPPCRNSECRSQLITPLACYQYMDDFVVGNPDALVFRGHLPYDICHGCGVWVGGLFWCLPCGTGYGSPFIGHEVR